MAILPAVPDGFRFTLGGYDMDIRKTKQYQRGRLDGINGREYGSRNAVAYQGIDSALYLAGFNIARGIDKFSCMSALERDIIKNIESKPA